MKTSGKGQDYYMQQSSANATAPTGAMGTMDLQRLKEGFTSLLSQAEPGLLPAFLLWVDLKVAEYKVHGYMFADPDNKHEGPWLQLAVDVLKFRFGGTSAVDGRTTPSNVHDKQRSETRRSGVSSGHSIESRLSHSSSVPRDCRIDLSQVLSQSQHQPRHSPGMQSYSPRNDLSMVASHLTSGGATSNLAPYDLSLGRVKQEPPHTPVKLSSMPLPASYSTPQKLQENPENLSAIAHSAPSHNLAQTYPILSKNLNPKHMPYHDATEPSRASLKVPVLPTLVEGALEHPQISKIAAETPQMSKLTTEHPQISKLAATLEQPHISKLAPEYTMMSALTAGIKLPDVMPRSSTSTPEKNPEATTTDADNAFLQTLNPASPNSMGANGKSPKAHICNICGKCFPYSSSFRRHLKLHQGVYTHVCAVCHRKFTRKEHFVRHKCNRRPNKPCRGLEGEVKPSVTGKVPKVEYPPMMPGEPYNLENKENNMLADNTESHTGGGTPSTEDYEVFDMPGSTSSPTPSQLAGESRRKSSKPRRCVQTDEESTVTNSFLDEEEDPHSVGSYPDSEHGDLVIDMSMDKDKEEERSGPDGGDSSSGSPTESSKPKRSQSGLEGWHVETWTHGAGIDLSRHSQHTTPHSSNAATLKSNGVPSPMVHPREASSPGSVLPHSTDDTLTDMVTSAAQRTIKQATMSAHLPLSSSAEDRMSPYQQLSHGDKPPYSPGPEQMHQTTAPPGEEDGKDDVLSLETGNYVVATVGDGSADPCSEEEPTGSPGKFIKVTKQSNYLKLQKEMRMVGGKPCFVCPKCSKVFHRSSNFSRHMRIHRGVYSYVCPTCNRGFFRKEHFQKHKCHRKAMSYVWERKTKVDMDMQKASSEDGYNDSEGADEYMEYAAEYGIDLNDYDESGESSTEEPLENGNHANNHSNPAIAIGNHNNGAITVPIPIAVPVE